MTPSRAQAEPAPPTSERRQPAPKVTVVFLLYHAADAVAGLVAALARQQPPAGADAGSWLDVVFTDDGSTDDTVTRLESELAAAALPFPVRVLRNEANLGLSGSLNQVLEGVESDYVLTCHLDCRFASDDYIARAVDLLDRHPDVGALSGQPAADLERGVSHVEKVYLTANLIDIFPDGTRELEPVGFAEGRCDGFRMDVLRKVGFYDTTVRRAGEDQVLSGRIRALGYQVCRAPGLRYYVSVSSSQDSLFKLVRHTYLFGRVMPYVLLGNEGTRAGAAGAAAGRNRTMRTALRSLQVAGAVSSLGLAVAVMGGRNRTAAGTVLAGTNLLKAALFLRHMRYLRFDARDAAALAALQPALDWAYAIGILTGLRHLVESGEETIT